MKLEDLMNVYRVLLSNAGKDRYTEIYQQALANVRDAIAEKSGIDSELIQNMFSLFDYYNKGE